MKKQEILNATQFTWKKNEKFPASLCERRLDAVFTVQSTVAFSTSRRRAEDMEEVLALVKAEALNNINDLLHGAARNKYKLLHVMILEMLSIILRFGGELPTKAWMRDLTKLCNEILKELGD